MNRTSSEDGASYRTSNQENDDYQSAYQLQDARLTNREKAEHLLSFQLDPDLSPVTTLNDLQEHRPNTWLNSWARELAQHTDPEENQRALKAMCLARDMSGVYLADYDKAVSNHFYQLPNADYLRPDLKEPTFQRLEHSRSTLDLAQHMVYLGLNAHDQPTVETGIDMLQKGSGLAHKANHHADSDREQPSFIPGPHMEWELTQLPDQTEASQYASNRVNRLADHTLGATHPVRKEAVLFLAQDHVNIDTNRLNQALREQILNLNSNAGPEDTSNTYIRQALIQLQEDTLKYGRHHQQEMLANAIAAGTAEEHYSQLNRFAEANAALAYCTERLWENPQHTPEEAKKTLREMFPDIRTSKEHVNRLYNGVLATAKEAYQNTGGQDPTHHMIRRELALQAFQYDSEAKAAIANDSNPLLYETGPFRYETEIDPWEAAARAIALHHIIQPGTVDWAIQDADAYRCKNG